jgi:hypothetical protein
MNEVLSICGSLFLRAVYVGGLEGAECASGSIYTPHNIYYLRSYIYDTIDVFRLFDYSSFLQMF